MKKLLAWLLLALLSVGLSATALAAVGSETQKSDASVPATFNFYQSYITSDNATPNTFPAETLHFTVVRAASNPDDTMITIADQTVDANPDEIVINVPAYTKVGHYIYTVTETAGSTQGVAYSAASFDVEVLVDFENQSDDRQTLRRLVVFKTHKKDASGKKVDTVTNTYDTGSLSVKKTVSGNLASNTQLFDIAVTFTAEEGRTVKSAITYTGGSDASTQGTIGAADWTSGTASRTIRIHDGETVTFSDIPDGVKYTVIEAEAHKAAAELNSGDDSKGYTATGEITTATPIVKGETTGVVVNNDKGTAVNTGISLDSLPYIIALTVVAVGAVVFLLRRRHRKDD